MKNTIKYRKFPIETFQKSCGHIARFVNFFACGRWERGDEQCDQNENNHACEIDIGCRVPAYGVQNAGGSGQNQAANIGCGGLQADHSPTFVTFKQNREEGDGIGCEHTKTHADDQPADHQHQETGAEYAGGAGNGINRNAGEGDGLFIEMSFQCPGDQRGQNQREQRKGDYHPADGNRHRRKCLDDACHGRGYCLGTQNQHGD